MPLMTLGKNKVYASTLGHVIRFVKDQPVNVPTICVRECDAIGAVLVGPSPEIPVNEDELADKLAAAINAVKLSEGISESSPVQPVVPVDRLSAIVAGAKAILARNEREDFTAAGHISLKAIGKETGFRIDKSELAEAMALINDPD